MGKGEREKENDTEWPPTTDMNPYILRGPAETEDLPAQRRIDTKRHFARKWIEIPPGGRFRGQLSYRQAHLMGIASYAPAIPLLQACREARDTAMESYELTFACPQSNLVTYFNFKTDTLYFDYGNFVSREESIPGHRTSMYGMISDVKIKTI